MARHLVALALCALAAAAAASSLAPKLEAQPALLDNPLQPVVEAIAHSLEVQVEALLAEANRHHSAAALSHGARGNIIECVATEWNDAVEVASRVLDLVYKIRNISKLILVEFKNCKGDIVENIMCRAKVVQQVLSQMLTLKDEAIAFLHDLKQAVDDIKACLHPQPTTAAPPTDTPPTPAPETPAPETPAPETPAPETPAPETPAPETPAPETPAPETPAPEPFRGARFPLTWRHA